MPPPVQVKVLLAPLPDGSTVLFFAPTSYKAGTTQLFRNGQAVISTDDDGWTETSPSLGSITMKIAPLECDRLLLAYRPI